MISLRLNPTRARRVTLTPLIDVVFILLVFFMLETTFREEGGLQMLSTQSGTSGGAADTALVELFDVETVWVDGQRFLFKSWSSAAGPIASTVELRTAPGIPLQHVVTVMDKLKQRGGERIRLGKVQGFN